MQLLSMSMVRFGAILTKNRTVAILIQFLKSETKTKPYINGAVWYFKFGFGFKWYGFGFKTKFIKYFKNIYLPNFKTESILISSKSFFVLPLLVSKLNYRMEKKYKVSPITKSLTPTRSRLLQTAVIN